MDAFFHLSKAQPELVHSDGDFVSDVVAVVSEEFGAHLRQIAIA